ncbi:MAG: MBL fold metallo-hydrolase [Chloroflexi bacterium]|nr:MBL fold metallo-hydrolase [Chloroflexota bacterium]
MQLHTLDLNFLNTPRAIASYVLVGPESAALIETGPGSCLQTALAGLRHLGIAPADVRDVLVTHIHLDHAGAAGWWARQGATIHVHPLGAPHLIDPSKLLTSAQRIYGDQMDYLWGEFLSAPVERVHIVNDGDTITAAGVEISAIETTGHARHHHTYRIGDIAFTGDSAGIRLPGSEYAVVPAPPPEFDLEAWEATVSRLAALDLKTIYPTHFGAVNDPAEHFRRYAPLVRECAEFIRARMEQGLTRDPIVEQYGAWHEERAEAAGLNAAMREHYNRVFNPDMGVDGIMRYWGKRKG